MKDSDKPARNCAHYDCQEDYDLAQEQQETHIKSSSISDKEMNDLEVLWGAVAWHALAYLDRCGVELDYMRRDINASPKKLHSLIAEVRRLREESALSPVTNEKINTITKERDWLAERECELMERNAILAKDNTNERVEV